MNTPAAVLPAPEPASAPVVKKGNMSLADLERRFVTGSPARPASAPDETSATKPAAAQSATTATATASAPATAGEEETDAASDPNTLTPAAAATADGEAVEAAENETSPEASADGTETTEPEAIDAKEPPQKLAKRLNKLVGALKEKDATLAALQAEVAQLKAKASSPEKPATAPAALDPAGWRPEVQAIDAEIAAAQQALQWAADNAEGGIANVGGNEQEFTAEQVRRIRDGAVGELAKLNARREVTVTRLAEQHEQARRAAVDTVLTAYPWAKNPESAQMKEWANLAQSIPPQVQQALNALPDGALMAADLVAGRLARLAAANAPKAKPAPAQRPTPQPASAAAAPVRVNPGRQKEEAVAAEVKVKGRMTVDQLTQRMAARREARLAA